ncbi:hypothetical protein WMF37_49225 [Sorangium sp. So ce291]|uniref:hypothetical protein n=1 Tax=Sorangium sp. So ce291 TaxID=3133294 RepID=UPI003F62F6FA
MAELPPLAAPPVVALVLPLPPAGESTLPEPSGAEVPQAKAKPRGETTRRKAAKRLCFMALWQFFGAE